MMKRKVKKPEERRQEIILTARQLFLDKGYDQATMQDVMKQLNIAKGTIYHYFKSKEELLEAVVQHVTDLYVEKIVKIMGETEGSAIEKLQILISIGNFAKEEPELMDKLHHPANTGMHTRHLAVTLTKLSPVYAKVIEQGCYEGMFSVDHPLETAEVMLAGIQFMTDVGCYSWTSEELTRRTLAIPCIMEAQLGAQKGTLNFLRNII